MLLDPVLAVGRHGDELGQRRHQRAAAAPLPPPGHGRRDPAPAAARAGSAQYAYLVGVAVVALTLGVGLTVAQPHRTRPARGMNGQLAWTQGTGMPMRPSMSVMMTADVPPVDADDAGVTVDSPCPPTPPPGEPTRVVVTPRRHRAPGSRSPT